MAVEYAPRGLLGVLTPQANTTVEPELAILVPPGFAWINGRLLSDRATIAERLLDYFDGFEASLRQFANAPVGAVAFACTGASYLAGAEAEDRALERLEAAAGVPVLTAASAVTDALRVLGAERLALVSPYDEALTSASTAYWTARGFTVTARSDAFRESDAFHPIYSLPSQAAEAALREVAGAEADAIILLGTGMPTLAPIRRTPRLGRAPVLSCMLCLAWRAAAALENREPSSADLLAWVDAGHWGRHPSAPWNGSARPPSAEAMRVRPG